MENKETNTSKNLLWQAVTDRAALAAVPRTISGDRGFGLGGRETFTRPIV